MLFVAGFRKSRKDIDSAAKKTAIGWSSFCCRLHRKRVSRNLQRSLLWLTHHCKRQDSTPEKEKIAYIIAPPVGKSNPPELMIWMRCMGLALKGNAKDFMRA
ncbi:UNVERIFIED_CONTAM: hypothetical protein K2H54_075173 [Gekko kuhli]